MFSRFFRRNKDETINDKVVNINQKLQNKALSKSLDKNIDTLNKLFTDVDILKLRYFQNNNDKTLKFCIAYCDGVVDPIYISESIIKPLMLTDIDSSKNHLSKDLLSRIIMIGEAKLTNKFIDIIEAVTYGDTVLFIDNDSEAIILNTKNFHLRSIEEPDSEKILSGPREGFCESLLVNLSLIRRKVRTNELKMKFYSLGKKTKTQTCICYIDSIVNKNVLKELYHRLGTIDIDAVLDSNYLTELIKDNPLSPFRTTGATERPDVVVGKLLEGRIAIFVDGSPVVLTIPYLFIENFQNSEDYYLNFYYASFSRMLRILGFILTISVPSLYIAAGAFHHEMLPTPLLIGIAVARQNVPLPASVEIFIMLIIFDILKETGVRMPSNIGQALSIVGALVIGQAAVDARLVASPMIIVVAITAITSLLIPKLNAPVIYVRVIILILSVSFGIFGYVWGISIIAIHILNLNSFGISQLTLSSKLQFQEVKDIYIRAPWFKMFTRPKMITDNKTRIKFKNGEKS